MKQIVVRDNQLTDEFSVKAEEAGGLAARMTREDAKQWLQKLNCYSDDRLLNADVKADADALMALLLAEREWCAKIAEDPDAYVPSEVHCDLCHTYSGKAIAAEIRKG